MAGGSKSSKGVADNDGDLRVAAGSRPMCGPTLTNDATRPRAVSATKDIKHVMLLSSVG